jgi:phage terminase large subunit-like protein
VFSRALEIAADIIDPRDSWRHQDWWMENPGDAIPGRARAKQRPPDGEWLVWLIQTGRGFGKTRTAAEYVDREARLMRRGDQVLVAGRTPSDVRTFSLEGPGGLLTHHPDIVYEPSKRELTWPNGVKGVIRSGANPEEFRGYSGRLAWLDEFAAWKYPSAAWENLMFGVRESDPRIVITTTPRPIPVMRSIRERKSTVIVTGSSLENERNLSQRWIEEVVEPLRGTRLGRQEVEGEMIDDAEGALWTRDLLERCRVASAPHLVRIVGGVDPQGRKGVSRETGIVYAGEGIDGRYYVVEDVSISGTPAEWGDRVVGMYHRLRADRIVGEVNYGGEMVEHTLRTVDQNVSFAEVRATRGKDVRAEPVSALYEKGRVSHVGAFPELEDEMCTWSKNERWSPNRLDALVWALTELAIIEAEEPPKQGKVHWTPGWRA